jgi:hypothetical protein
MPKYFFEVVELDGTIVHDEVEVELSNKYEALDNASRTLVDVLRDRGLRHQTFHIMVLMKDETGREIGRRDGALSQSDEVE